MREHNERRKRAEKEKGLKLLKKPIAILSRLWTTQEILRLQNIRFGHLQYMLAFPLAMLLINVQECMNAKDLYLFGFPSYTITILAFAMGASLIKFFSSKNNLRILSRISAAVLLVGFVSWIFISGVYPSLICSAIFMLGVGGCMAASSFAFVFILNNSERFFGCVFMSLCLSLATITYGYILQYLSVRICFLFILTASISICMIKIKSEDFEEARIKSSHRLDPSIWLALFLVLSYFTVRVFGHYIPEFQVRYTPQLINALFVIPPLLCVVMVSTFKMSIWTMCNIFFISSIMCYVLSFAQLHNVAYAFFGLKEIGFLISFYLLTCAINKFCSMRMHKVVSTICILLIVAIYITPDFFLKDTVPHSVAVIIPSGLFMFFLLLAPAFSKYLFIADWSVDFVRLYMSEIEAQVALAQTDNANLSPLEKEALFTGEEMDVALLLIEGETPHGISRKLHRPAADISEQLNSIRNKVIRKSDPDPGVAVVISEYKLTRREADMLRCLCRRMTNVEIATELVITEDTAKKHVRSLMRKLPVDDRKDVAGWVHSLGLNY